MNQTAQGACTSCRHLLADAADLEARLPGLASLSSAFAAVRAADGLCTLHGRYVAGTGICPAYHGRTEPAGPAAA